MIKKIFSQSILYFLAMYMPLVANIFILPVINKFLSTDDYAIYGLTFGYMSLLAGFGDLGLTSILQNSYFKNKENYKEIWSQFTGFLHLYRILYGGILAILIYFIFKNRIGEENIYLFVALTGIPVILFDFTKTIGIRLCQFESKHRLVYIATLGSGIITITTTFVTIYFYKLGFVGWFIAAFLAKAFEFLYYGYYLYYVQRIRPNYRFSRILIWEKIGISLPLIPKRYSNYLINNSDRAMLDIFRAQFGSVTLGEIGLYNIGYSFANYFGSFNQAINTVVTPIYFRLFAKDNDKVASHLVVNLTLLWFSFSLASGFFLCLWLKEILEFLYPKPEFFVAYSYSIFIIMALCYRPLYVAIIDKAIFKEKTKSTMKISLSAGLLNILLNIITIPFMGLHGAILSSFVAYVFLGFGAYFMKDFKSFREPLIKPILLLLYLIGASLAAYALKDLSIPHKILISFLLIILAVTWYFIKGKNQITQLNKYRFEE